MDKIERIGLLRELAAKLLENLKSDQTKNSDWVANVRALLGRLGVNFGQPAVKSRVERQAYYAFDENRTKTQRQQANNAVFELLDKIDSGELLPEQLTEADKEVLAKYSGNGGGLKGRDGKIGSAHEYYTPAPIAESMWKMMQEMGFSGGKVLDPCAGTGIFGALAPENAVVDAVEMDETSAQVNRLVNGGVDYSVTTSPFEAVAADTPDETYDAVVTNVPFGSNASRKFKNKDSKYRQETMEGYFVLRCLDKLKPKGMAAFLVPSSFVDGKGAKTEKIRLSASLKAEFIGAFRLPSKVFSSGDTGADVVTDIVVFRKYSRDVLDKISELQEQNPNLLSEANVLWEPFLSGKYFKKEGIKYIIGTPAKRKNRFGKIVDTVLSDDSVSNIAKAIKAFGGSRVQWDLLDAQETSPIIYNDGDVIHQDGQTLVWQGGRFVLQAMSENEASSIADSVISEFDNAVSAFHSHVSFKQLHEAVSYYNATDMGNYVPSWAKRVLNGIQKVDEHERESQFKAVITGLAMLELLDTHAGDDSFNFLESYSELSESMRVYERASVSSVLDKVDRDAVKSIKIHYNKKSGYSAVWKGERGSLDKEHTQEQKLEALQYASGSLEISIDDMKSINPDFNIMEDDDWAISADGTRVIKMDDLLVGNYGEMLEKLDNDIQSAASPEIAAKIARVKALAAARVKSVNVDKMRFDLRSPLITVDEVAAFLRTLQPTPNVVIEKDEKGRAYVDIQNKKTDDNISKLQNRLGDHIKNGTLTLGGMKLYDGSKELKPEKAMAEFRAYRDKVNAIFNTWVHANPSIKERLNRTANDPKNIYFEQASDERPLEIEGMNNDDWKLHGYQADYVRKQSRLLGGINGFGTGLGKTLSALATVQYAQNIGTKKKTLFVVPNNVLSNWYKEAISGDAQKGGVYDSATAEKCLFVGADITESKSISVDSANYARDLNRILDNAHNKVFMTYEAFQKIRLKSETVEAYQSYLRGVDKSYAEVERKADDEKNESRLNNLADILTEGNGKLANAPYFEDMGFDSIVIDEAHAFKNSKQTFSFGKQAKGLGNTDSPSSRGLDAMAKTWFIRNGNARKDGVLCLTATPLTNSPLEIYSMMGLARGEERVNQAMLGVNGADDFMKMVCELQNRDDYNIIGEYVPQDMFMGLKNVELLRNLINDVAVIKNASDVGLTLRLPGAEEIKTPITLTDSGKRKLELYKTIYSMARDAQNDNSDMNNFELLERVSKEWGESINLMAQPFNLISKMDALILDEELDAGVSIYTITGDKEVAEKAVDEFNGMVVKEQRLKQPRNTDESDILSKKIEKDNEGNVRKITYTIHARAKWQDDGHIVLDSVDFETQSKLEALLDKYGVSVSVTASPKLAALITNAKNEQSNIRAYDVNGNKLKNAKQIVFCDALGTHRKIKRLLADKAGIPADKITFVSGKFNNEPEQIIDVQNGFNSDEDNKYCVVIANKKAEVGINLQKGTQAIHHLTIAWTPDSLVQRNGRGVRQGNAISSVNVYYYDADGTFDQYRRNVVEKKGDWIGNLMDGRHDVVEVSGGLTNEQYDRLIRADGTAADLQSMQREMEEQAKQERINRTKSAQKTNLEIYKREVEFQKKFRNYGDWLLAEFKKFDSLIEEVKNAKERLNKSIDKGASNKTIKANEIKLEKAQKILNDALARLDGNFRVKKSLGNGKEYSLSEWVSAFPGSYRPSATIDDIVDGTPLQSEWEQNMEISRNMMKAAKKSMLQDAADVAGSYSQDVLNIAMEKSYILFKGNILVDGMIARSGSTVYMTNNSRILEQDYEYPHAPRNVYDYERIDAVFYLPNAPEAQEILKYMGEHDGKVIESFNGNVPHNSVSMLASSYIPEVKPFIPDVKVRPMVHYKTPMKPPYFVRYLPILNKDNLSEIESIDGWKQVIDKQREITAEDAGDGLYIFVDNEDVFDTSIQLTDEMIVDSMKAHHLKLPFDKLGILNPTLISGIVSRAKNSDAYKQLVELAKKPETEIETLKDAANAWAKAAFEPVCTDDVDLFTNSSLSYDARELMTIFENAHKKEAKFAYLTGNTYSFAQNVGGYGLRQLAQSHQLRVAWVDKTGSSRYKEDKDLIKESKLMSHIRSVWLIEYDLWRLIESRFGEDIREYGIVCHRI